MTATLTHDNLNTVVLFGLVSSPHVGDSTMEAALPFESGGPPMIGHSPRWRPFLHFIFRANATPLLGFA